MEEETRRAELQVSSQNARRPDHHAGRAAPEAGPAAEPHHRPGETHAAEQEEQGGQEKQEEHEEDDDAH